MKVYVLGGFLGAGKTTAIRALAKLLHDRGERVAVVTNDQGHALVDTAACRDSADVLQEIGGGCFCCRYGELEDALAAAADEGATVALAEAVGSCTDLVATVLSPLSERCIDRLQIAPLSVLVDPWRAQEIRGGALPDIRYLFEKQIQEADVVVLTRADLDPPDIEPWIREIAGDVATARISSVTGAGVADWLGTRPRRLASPLDIDYDRYAAAEALLGWANGRVVLTRDQAFSPRAVIRELFAHLAGEPIAHLKVRVEEPADGWANLVRERGALVTGLDDLPEETRELRLLVNARIALPAAQLEERLREVAARMGARWQELECFEPSRPVPVHRHATRCDPAGDAACCAAFYQTPTVQYLLGDSYHPGGRKLTLQMAERLDLADGKVLLDVACGAGTSLRTIRDVYPIVPIGMDVSPSDPELLAGDAHRIPRQDASVDAVLCECALSTFADQPQALGEMLRVLRPGGRVAISDMVANGPVPEALAEWVHVGTCLSHARSLSDYAALLQAVGFEVVATEDATWALDELLKQIKRRILAAAIGKAAGALPEGVDIDVAKGKAAVREAQQVVRDGAVGYGFLVARKP